MANTTAIDPVKRLTSDIIAAAVTLTDQEARFLVDAYYIMQEDRKRAHNQERSLEEGREPNSVITWLAENSQTLEDQIKRALDRYTDGHPVGKWLKSIVGIGPVIAAGLLAHIDIDKAPTAGHIWRFAGLDPTVKWSKGEKRPWNAKLKTLSWKAGQSFMKFSNNENCLYGHLYRERKAYEQRRNDSGENAEVAARILTEKKFDKTTEAYKAMITGKLPLGQIDGRARRWAVKLFLSHLQSVWIFIKRGELPASPYSITALGHAHITPPPCMDVVPGLGEAWRVKFGSY